MYIVYIKSVQLSVLVLPSLEQITVINIFYFYLLSAGCSVNLNMHEFFDSVNPTELRNDKSMLTVQKNRSTFHIKKPIKYWTRGSNFEEIPILGLLPE